MNWFGILGVAIAAAVAIVLLTAYICFRITFYVSKGNRRADAAREFPDGKIYEPHHETMRAWMKRMKEIPHREVSITSFDGLKLYGDYYEYEPGAPVELMFHGYRGLARRDLCGGIQRCFALRRNVLLVDLRACGRSEGNVITFGVHESRDCLSWIEYLRSEFGSDVKIILTGISMGASTVMIAAGMDLPDNVVGILADCGFTSARAIIKKVIRQLHLPADVLYPIVRLGARLYGRFDPEERSAIDAMPRCRVPIIFYHGEADDFVPCEMSRENYAACPASKRLVTVPDAGHGLAFILDQEGYVRALKEFSVENNLSVSF